ncbi:MAG: radical SAM protein [Candidatus Aminicenantes bacterium]|nr:radical SAM protein [Candidatus Aminicenantes bacterium]
MYSLVRLLLHKPTRLSLFDIHRLFMRDANYSITRGIALARHILKHEKIIRFNGSHIISSFLPPIPSKALLSFIRSGQHEDRLFSDLIKIRRSAPLSVYLCVTDRCNYHCQYCSADYVSARSDPNTEQWKTLIRTFQNMGTANIGFTGGEPLLREDIEAIIASVDDRSTTVLFTNGFDLIPERARSLKQSGLFALSISLDSHDAAIHNRLKGHAQAFEKACAAIENAAREGFYTIVQAVIFQEELVREKVLALCRLAEKLGAHEIRIHQPTPSGRLLNMPDANGIFYTDQDREKLFAIQKQANRVLGKNFKVTSFPFTEGAGKFGCTAGLFHSYVSASGELFPCDFIPLSFGNLFEGDAARKWQDMADAIKRPRSGCWSTTLKDKLTHTDLPLSKEKAIRLCQAEQPSSFPGIYRKFHLE